MSRREHIEMGSRMECGECGAVGLIPEEIHSSHLPIWLECGYCKGETEWSRLPVLPKINPTSISSTERPKPYTLYQDSPAERAATEQLRKAMEAALPPDSPELKPDKSPGAFQSKPLKNQPMPFWRSANFIGKLTRQLFRMTDHLKQEIGNFQDEIGKFFEDYWRNCTRFARSWHKDYLQEFLDYPYVIIPVNLENEETNKYTRWVLAPKFFDPGLGIPIHHQGGFRLELVSAYSRIEFPLEISDIDLLGVPPGLDLKVQGNKIVGSSLPFCWEDIPGLITDHDHTPEWPSVYMRHPEQARIWLIRHGVNPWEHRKITLEELNSQEIDSEIAKQPIYLDAWKRLRQYGRLGIFWPSVMEARRFAMLAGYMLKGVTCVFVANENDKIAWNSLYQQWHHPSSRQQEFAFFTNRDTIMWDAVLRCKSVIMDFADTTGDGGLDLSVLNRFFDYHGRLLMINLDPISDLFTDDWRVAQIYGLSGHQLFERANWNQWPAVPLQIPDLARTFSNMFVKNRYHSLAPHVRQVKLHPKRKLRRD